MDSYDNDPYRAHEYDYDYIYDDPTGLIDANYMDYGYQPETTTFTEITTACVLPTLTDVCSTYISVLGICLAFQIANKYLPFNVTSMHTIAGSLGLAVLYSYFQYLILHCVILSFSSYVIIYLLSSKYYTTIVPVTLLSYLTICEFIFDGSSWARIRNVQMLIVMKIISLIFDLENKRIATFPSLEQFFGYVFCVGNSIFGPWINFSSYLSVFQSKKLDFAFVGRLITSILKSLFFFTASMCYLDWIWSENHYGKYVVMYLKAMEFRTGHYFIMFMSESFAIAIGFDRVRQSVDADFITAPSKIEFPHSLEEVVVYWNMPMHKWLKTYVFKPLSKHGRLIAVIGTYLVSSLLHGLNYQLSGILLSLAAYTYVEHIFRAKLSYAFNACISSRLCKLNCEKHKHSRNKIAVCFCNYFFTFLALFHLSYLGHLIDLRNQRSLNFTESFDSWRKEGFSSHFIVLITFLLSFAL